MKIVVIGGTGLIGSKLVGKLRQLNHEVIAASPATGINTITGEGLAEALSGTDVVVDLSNSPSFADKDVMDFFETSGRNLLAAETGAGVKHHIALSVVGTDRLQESGYFRAKQVQEDLIKKSGVPYSIIHSTQFMEFLGSIAASAYNGESMTLSPANIQPIASDDVASFVAETVLNPAINGIVEIAGPEHFQLAELVKQYLIKTEDPRSVIADENALYFGARLSENTLLPADMSRVKVGQINFEQWFSARPVKA